MTTIGLLLLSACGEAPPPVEPSRDAGAVPDGGSVPCNDGAERPCGVERGVCHVGVERCLDGVWGACEGAVGRSDEVCNGEDDDCDGEVDEDGCDCAPGLTRPCGSDVGACVPGVETCAEGRWGTCEGALGPAAEACDGILDENCDGSVDEGCACSALDGPRDCGTAEGRCELGTQRCVDGAWAACEGGVEPIDEVCNGVDDDCDGGVDDEFDVGAACDGADSDECDGGLVACDGPLATLCTDPPDSIPDNDCDGEDDDCDGSVDDDRIGSFACDSPDDDDLCQDDVLYCYGVCADLVWDHAEACNGRDDDCDGAVDEDFGIGIACDGPDADLCEEGETTCGGCTDETADDREVCDGIDDDCDGSIDEDFGVGDECDGPDLDRCADDVITCAGCEDVGGDVAELCSNGLDDDCDGAIDEDFALGAPCDGLDADRCAEGIVECAGCSDETDDSLEVCNGEDDDCDGFVDDRDQDGFVDALCGGDDCDDADASMHPEAREICGNDVDDDCDGGIDDLARDGEECAASTACCSNDCYIGLCAPAGCRREGQSCGGGSGACCPGLGCYGGACFI